GVRGADRREPLPRPDAARPGGPARRRHGHPDDGASRPAARHAQGDRPCAPAGPRPAAGGGRAARRAARGRTDARAAGGRRHRHAGARTGAAGTRPSAAPGARRR
ncbi:MAG: hypothetical protein AVDCRST_MAG79-840, partial [uncultured Thermoleophilia bacterium]